MHPGEVSSNEQWFPICILYSSIKWYNTANIHLYAIHTNICHLFLVSKILYIPFSYDHGDDAGLHHLLGPEHTSEDNRVM